MKLPAGAEPPFTVFINGIEQSEGADYRIEAGEIVFDRPIVKEKVGTGRWLAMYLGLFGTYRKNETIDLQFSRTARSNCAPTSPSSPTPRARRREHRLPPPLPTTARPSTASST